MVEYKRAEKITWESIKEEIPEQLIPKKKMIYIFEAIFVIILLIQVLLFPWGKMFSPQSLESGLELSFGWPMHYFIMSFNSPEKMPIKFLGLLIDSLIYLIISYFIEIILNYLKTRDITQIALGNEDFVKAKPKIVIPKKRIFSNELQETTSPNT